MAQQIHPDALQMLTAADLQRVEAQVKADLAPRQCLQAGPLDAGQVESLRTLLEAQWAADTWQLNTVAATRTSSARPVGQSMHQSFRQTARSNNQVSTPAK